VAKLPPRVAMFRAPRFTQTAGAFMPLLI